MDYYPEQILVCSQRFETDSAGAREVVEIFNSNMQEMAYNGISEERFGALKERLLKGLAAAQQGNGYWLDIFTEVQLSGLNFNSGFSTELNNITSADFKEFVQMLYRRGNRITVTMEGTTEDVNTQNLFRENQFIKDFFDL